MNKHGTKFLFAIGMITLSFVFGLHWSTALAADTTLRVATWNIAAKNHPDISQMTALFAERNIDIIGYQEVDVLNGRNPYDMAQAFASHVYPYVHFAKGRDFSDGSFGVGIASQYALTETSAVPLDSTGSKATKTLERVVFEKDGKQIAFYNTHLSWENLDLRRRQIKEVIDRVNMDPVAYKVITADFNTDQHPYEYAMFLDQFNIANGHNGKWFNTYGEDDDPSMKVFTIDNIIATKNMRITNVDMVKSHLSDHFMLVADFTLLDHEGEGNSNNLALGQGVSVTSTRQNLSPYLLVNHEKQTPWVSDSSPDQEITIELDRLYTVDKIIIHWGKQRASRYRVLGSADGENYVPIKESKRGSGSEDVLRVSAPVKFIKFELKEKVDAGKGYEIREIQVFGDKLVHTPDPANLLTNGVMETGSDGKLAAWELQTAKGAADSSAYRLSADFTEKHSGNSAAKLTRSDTAEKSGDGALVQTIALAANRQYQLTLWHKSQGLNSGAFTYEINQKDEAGKTIDTHLVKMNDNVNMRKDWRLLSYNFVTSPKAKSATVALRVVSGEGSLWIDDVSVKEVIPTESILLSTSKRTLAIGKRTKMISKIMQENASDVLLHWVSSDEAVAIVDQQGNVTAVGTGKAYIGLESGGDLIAESKLLITVE